MQLPLSADVLVPVGVGVLVAVVAVIALVFGLRRRAEDAPTPTDDDWTSEHVGDVVTPPTRTVADAVAERHGNTGPFVVVAPGRPKAVASDERNGNGHAAGAAVPLSSLGPVVSASVVARQRRAVQASARPGTVALAEPGEVVAGAEAVAGSTAVEGSVADTALRAHADRGGPGGGGDDRPPFPADPLFGAGRFDQIGPDGDPWFTPPSLPRTQLGGPSTPIGPEDPAGDEPVGERPEDPAAAPREPAPVATDPAAARQGAGNGQEPLPEPAHPTADGPGRVAAHHPAANVSGPMASPPAHPASGEASPLTQGDLAAASAADHHDVADVPERAPAAPPPAHTAPWERAALAHGGPAAASRPDHHEVADVPGSAPAASPPARPDGGPASPTHGGLAAADSHGLPERAPMASPPARPATGASIPSTRREPAAPEPDRHAVANVPEPAAAPEDGPTPLRYPVVNVPEPASAPERDGRGADDAAPGAGSSQSVAAAVAQVLAARAAAHAPEGDRRGDARDRLLAVLLDDPMRAVGAAVDLQECQERLDRLAASLQDERGRLGDVLGRLARSGLRPDQLARLSGLSDGEVAELLRRGPGA